MVILLRPSKSTVDEDKEVHRLLQSVYREGHQLIACKDVAESMNMTETLLPIGIKVKYVGKYIGNRII